MLGDYGASRAQAMLAAEDVRRARWEDLPLVTLRLLAFNEWSLVSDLIHGADWRHPQIIRNAHILSQHLWLIGEVPGALRMIDSLAGRVADNASLSYSRALALRYLGRLDEARDELENCLRISPSHPYAHWSLAYHGKPDVAGARIPRVKQALETLADDADERPYLEYALYREFECAGDYAEAWRYLSAGAMHRRAQLNYSLSAEIDGFTRQRAFFENPAESMDTHGDDGWTPVFIVGMPRTGTTLLERILGNHSAVSAAGELNDMSSSISLASNRFSPPQLTPEYADLMAGSEASQIAEYYWRNAGRHRPDEATRWLTDKNPINFMHVPAILASMPRAKVLCLHRSGMDACFSNLKELFSNASYGYSYDLGELGGYYREFTRMREFWSKHRPDSFLSISYEDMVTNAERVATDVMGFCGMPFEPGCSDITRNHAPVTTASSTQVRQSINRKGIDAWKPYEGFLSPLIEAIA